MPFQRWIRAKLRRLMLVLTALLLAGGAVSLTVVTAVPALAASCGDVLVSGSSWMGGNGVDVHSNGVDMEGPTACANNDTAIYNLNANPPIYGLGWQCVELVNRLYASKGWYSKLTIPATYNGQNTNYGAKWLYTLAAAGYYKGLTAHVNGSNYTPAPGDMIVHSNGTYGHVAVVSSINGTSISAVDQNRSYTGWETYTWNPTTHKISMSGATISGFVHADKNTVGGPPPPPPPPSNFNGDELAFQDNTGSLWVYGNAGTHDLGLGVKPGTSPAIAALSNGSYEVAFQANDGSFYLYTPGGGATDLALGMMPGTSPAITALSGGGGIEAAFQDSSGALWVYGNAGIHDLGLGMKAGTSPAIAALSNGSYEVAFQANDGSFYLYTPAGGATDLALGMMPGTSPAIVGLTSGGMEAAFEDSSGALWVYGNAGIHDLALGMMPGTSPAIAALSNGSYEVAFQGNDGSFYLYTPASGLTSVNLGMSSGTSPSITGLRGGGIEAAFQDNTGALWVYGNGGTLDLKLGMMPSTSPAIAGS